MRDRIPNLKKEDTRRRSSMETLLAVGLLSSSPNQEKLQRFTFRQLHSIFITGHVPSKTVGHTVAEHTTTHRQTLPSRPSQAEGYTNRTARSSAKSRTTTLHITRSSEAYIFHLTHAA